MARKRNRDPLVWGVILIGIGIIIMLENLNIDIWDSIARLWPLILIFWGGWKLYFGLKERSESMDITQEEK